MVVPSEAEKVINSEVLSLRIEPENEAMSSMLKFKWNLVSYTETGMEI